MWSKFTIFRIAIKYSIFKKIFCLNRFRKISVFWHNKNQANGIKTKDWNKIKKK